MKMSKKYTILIPLFILGMVFLDFSIVDRPYHVGWSYAQRCRDYNPTHRTAIDLWIRNDIPRYSFRTGEWILGKKIGVIKMNSEFQMKNSRTVGLTQVWMEICFKLPDGRVVGGTGYWIWAGQAGTLENVTELSPQSNYYRKRRYSSFSFIRNACAQTDTDTGPSREMKTQLLEETGSDTVRKIEDNTQDIKEQLNNWKLVPLKYLSLYFVLLIGMIVGSAWDWLNLKPSEHTSNSKNVFYKNALKKITGSLISFSFFIGPVMGIGEIGFTISSAILAFHFGLVHYDPTELVYTLRSKYSTSG